MNGNYEILVSKTLKKYMQNLETSNIFCQIHKFDHEMLVFEELDPDEESLMSTLSASIAVSPKIMYNFLPQIDRFLTV